MGWAAAAEKEVAVRDLVCPEVEATATGCRVAVERAQAVRVDTTEAVAEVTV